MNFESMTDHAIALEIGQRIEQMRLQQNLTQQYLADQIGLSRVSYRKLVNGSGKFENIIALLRVLGRMDLVEKFIPPPIASPMQQLKMQSKQRQRARSSKISATKDRKDNDQDLDW